MTLKDLLLYAVRKKRLNYHITSIFSLYAKAKNNLNSCLLPYTHLERFLIEKIILK